MKVNLCCGDDYREGWINTDFYGESKADILFDVEKDKFPMEDNSVDYVYSRMLFEHLHQPSRVLAEIYRVLKPKGSCEIITTHFSNAHAFFGDIHVSTFSRLYWQHFTKKTSHRNWKYRGTFEFTKMKYRIVFAKGWMVWNHLVERCVNINLRTQRIFEETFLRNLFPADEVKVIFEK